MNSTYQMKHLIKSSMFIGLILLTLVSCRETKDEKPIAPQTEEEEKTQQDNKRDSKEDPKLPEEKQPTVKGTALVEYLGNQRSLSKESHVKIQELIDNPGVDINAVHPVMGLTALMLASKNGHETVVRLLLEKSDLNKDFRVGNLPSGKNAVDFAEKKYLQHLDSGPDDFRERYAEIITLLSGERPITPQDYKDALGREISRIINACNTPEPWRSKDKIGMRPSEAMRIIELIKLGANVNVRNNSGYSPLHYAVRTPKCLDLGVIQNLLEAGANHLAESNPPQTKTVQDMCRSGIWQKIQEWVRKNQ